MVCIQLINHWGPRGKSISTQYCSTHVHRVCRERHIKEVTDTELTFRFGPEIQAGRLRFLKGATLISDTISGRGFVLYFDVLLSSLFSTPEGGGA